MGPFSLIFSCIDLLYYEKIPYIPKTGDSIGHSPEVIMEVLMQGGGLKSWGVWAGMLIFAVESDATYSRVESMGKKATFFMDDVSIFENPANINIFPNFLVGELGVYRQGDADKRAMDRFVAGGSGTSGFNRDPENSWFGGLFSYSLSRDGAATSLYPQISLGGAFNRIDPELQALIPDSADGKPVPPTATNFDGFLGFTFSNGGMLGSHVHIALQEGADLRSGVIESEPDDGVRADIMRGDLGLNWPVARNVDAEVALGTAYIGYGPDNIESEWSYFITARTFSTLELINGELVPIFKYSILKAPGQEQSRFKLGSGVNVSLDRGFFWLGVEGIFEEHSTTGITPLADGGFGYSSLAANVKGAESIRGGAVSFGIERNVWWDWLVLRVGGRKEITYREVDGSGGSYNYIYTNPTGNATPEDHVGFGIGINVEEKLKVDAVLAEDLLFTFGNLFSGPHHHLISRIAATYSF